jgi:serine protease
MRLSRTRFISVMVMGLVFGLTAVCWGQGNFKVLESGKPFREVKFASGEFLVKFKKGVPEKMVRQINKKHGVSVLSVSPRGKFLRLRVPKGRTVEEMVAVYAKIPHVQYAEPNYIMRALMVPNDTYYDFQWHMQSINMESAWDITQGDPGVVVAVVDTGVAYRNDDLGLYAQAPDLVNTKFVQGHDFINNDQYPDDDHGHGTHVAGTIAQSTNNVEGVTGIAFKTAIMPVKVLNAVGSGTDANVADGIYYAADNGADVINMSLGDVNDSTTVKDACAYAYNKGVTIVCAAGNDYQTGNRTFYPAAYNEYCIAVGATRWDNTRSFYSNTGEYLDLTAPGGDLNVDQNGDGYADGVLQNTYWFYFPPFLIWFDYVFMQGTSMASPHVAGVAALLIAHGVTGPDRVREYLQGSAIDLGPAEEFGHGLVDAYAALTYSPSVQEHDIAITSMSAPASCCVGEVIDITVRVTNQSDFNETNVPVTVTDTNTGEVIGTKSVDLAPGKSTVPDLVFSWDTAGKDEEVHVLKVEATLTDDANPSNNSKTADVEVKAQPVHDVAVLGVDAPASVTKGQTITVNVTVKNEGTVQETTTVTLTSSLNGNLGSKPVTLAPGGQEVVPFIWDTDGATTGDHVLTAKAAAVPSETDTADNISDPLTVTITEQGIMHVASIDMALEVTKVRKDKDVQASAKVTIVDANGTPVQATVSGEWTVVTNKQSQNYEAPATLTNDNGQVVFSSETLTNPAKRKTTFTFEVTGVQKTNYTYNANANLETSDSITY